MKNKYYIQRTDSLIPVDEFLYMDQYSRGFKAVSRAVYSKLKYSVFILFV